MSDIGYRIKLYSDTKYRTLLSQSDIGCSDIRISPISLITDIATLHITCQCYLYLLYYLKYTKLKKKKVNLTPQSKLGLYNSTGASDSENTWLIKMGMI
jgi:hypothetical protein